MKKAEHRGSHIGVNLIDNRSTRVLTGGGKAIDELHLDKKAGENFTKISVDGVTHYSYIGDKPKDVCVEDEILLNEETSLPNNGIKRKMEVTWDGAAQSARRPIEDKLCLCDACNEKFKYASELAFVDASGQFSKKQDAFLTTLLIDNGMNTFSNQFRATKIVCIKCMQKMHKPAEPYYSLSADGHILQTSKWSNLMKATKKTRVRNRELPMILHQIAAAAKRQNLNPVLFSPAALQAKYNE